MADRLLGILIPGFWVIMMFLLVRRDLIPMWTASRPPSYKTLLERRLQAESYRMGVWWSGNKLGVSRTRIEPSHGDLTYGLENHTTLNTPFPGLNDVEIRSQTRVGRDYQLRDFTSTLRTGELTGKVFAQVEGNWLRVEMRVNGEQAMTHRVPYDAGGTFSNGLSPFVQMPDLTVGKEWTIHSVNPLNGGTESGTARVVELETLAWEGEEVEVFRVVLTSERAEATSWIDRTGRILKEEIPFLNSKLVMIREK